MLNPRSPLGQLIAAPMRDGIVQWIGLRPQRRAEMLCVPDVILCEKNGLLGDRYAGRDGQRHVTIIEAESLVAIANYLGVKTIAAHQLRRNILVAGTNLRALKDQSFELGSATLEVTGECHPCSRMEEVLGAGGYNAVRGHGGITARVVKGGALKLGQTLRRLTR